MYAARKMRDPYFDMSYKELKGLLKDQKLCLEKAVSTQDFRKAAEIEIKM